MSNEARPYSYRRIRDSVYELAKSAALSPANHYSETVWDYHVLPVVRFALRLARVTGADRETVELAALLHDHSCLVDKANYPEHHRHSARMASEILGRLGYPPDRIRAVTAAIRSHRGSVRVKRTSREAEVLASADAMAHITELPDMMYLAYGIHRLRTREGAAWLLEKLGRSWKKIMPAGRRMIAGEYRTAVRMLEKAAKK